MELCEFPRDKPQTQGGTKAGSLKMEKDTPKNNKKPQLCIYIRKIHFKKKITIRVKGHHKMTQTSVPVRHSKFKYI